MRLQSTDLYESSYFLASGARLAEVKTETRKRPTIVFAFEDKENRRPLSELQNAYHSGHAEINLSIYRHNLELLRDIMYRNLKKLEALMAREELPRRQG